MTTCFLAPDPIQSCQLIPGGNVPANGGQLFFYITLSATKQTVYKDNAAAVAWSNPIVLDSGGNLPNGGQVWFPTGQTFTVKFAPSNDTDPPGSPYWTKDNLSGINDVAAANSSTVPFTQSGTGASTSTVQTELRRIHWIQQYGAVVDGITDDWGAVTTAIAALGSGDTLYYSGTPLISKTLDITKKIKLQAVGGVGTTVTDFPTSYFIKKSTMTSAAIILHNSGIIMEGGGVVAQAGNTGDNIILLSNSVTCRDVTSARAGNDGFRVGLDAAGVNCNSWILDNCHSYSNIRHGLLVHSGDTNANAGTALAFEALVNGGDGIQNNNATLNSYVSCVTETNTGVGLHLTSSAQFCVIVGGDSEANVSTQILIDAGAQNNVVMEGPQNQVTDNTTPGMIRPDRLTMKQGTSTLALGGTVTTGVNTYIDSTCTWQRMGDLVHVTGRLTLASSDAVMSGNLQIRGIPFLYPSAFVGGMIGFAIAQYGRLQLIPGYTLNAQMAANASTIALVQSAPNSTAAFVNATSAPSSSQIYFSGWYPVASF